MATIVLQHVRHLSRHLGFFEKYIFSAKLQPIFLKVIGNTILLPQMEYN